MTAHVKEGPFRAGDEVAVRHGRKWWAAQIADDLGGGHYRVAWSYRVHWWLPGSDVVPVDRMRRRHEVRIFQPYRHGLILAAVILFLSAAVIGGSLLALRPWERFGPATGTVQFEAGQRVQVEWQGEWYDGAIIEVHGPAALARDHYRGSCSFWAAIKESPCLVKA
jgi:hypothetical protein